MLKHSLTYEIMRPEDVGVRQSRLVLGKHSGRHALRKRLEEMGYALSEAQLDAIFEDFKRLADRKKVITDADLEALVNEERYQVRELYALSSMEVTCGTVGTPTARVQLRTPDGSLQSFTAQGTGPVDATYKAIDAIVNVPCELVEYNVHAVTEGIDAIGEVTVRIRPRNGQKKTILDAQTEEEYTRIYGGHGADTDIVVASAKAYLNALNMMIVSSLEQKTGVSSDYGVIL
jgi:2-isopropylmalate synthase